MPPREHCWACRKLRLVCDSRLPDCARCIQRGTPCPGYGVKPLTWITTGSSNYKSSDRREGVSTSQNKMISRAREPKALKKGAFDGVVTHLEEAMNFPKGPSASMSIPFEIRTIIGAVEYHNAKICLDMVSFDSLANPHRIQPPEVQLMPQSLLHAIISIAFSHRAIQKMRKTLEGCNSGLQAAAYHHRGIALLKLKEEIALSGPAASYVTLITVLVFLIAELQQSSYGNWSAHMECAKKIIEVRGGLEKVVGLDPSLDSLLAYLVVIDIMSTTTSPAIGQPRTVPPLHYTNIPPDLYRVVCHTCFPCPPAILQEVIQINNLRLLQRKSNSQINGLLASGSGILKRLITFSPSKWARDMTAATISSNFGAFGHIHSGWLCIAHVYHAAVVLYGISSLAGLELNIRGDSTQTIEELSQVRTLFRKSLSLHLTLIFSMSASPEQAQIKKLVIWPLVIAGIETEIVDSNFRKFICKELEELGPMLGTASPLEAKEFLGMYWNKREGNEKSCRPIDWDDIFDRHYVFVI